jgi:4-hydroxy-3-polyprenylbenzoate decarboxylase
MLHQGDGGRYIGTWHTVITKMPDGNWTNWGMYRLMVHDRKTLGGLIVPTQHIGVHFKAWQALGRNMPFAVAIGTDPITPLVSSMAIPEGVDEAGVVGAIRGRPLDVVGCETVDLQVPARAEIVIEGEVSCTEMCWEGPFGEYTGFMSRNRALRPAFKVSAITHRRDPILPVVCPGEPVDDHLCMSLSLAADALAELRNAGLPVLRTHIPAVAALHLLVVSVDKTRWTGSRLATAIGECIWSTKIGTLLPKIVVVDADVDVADLNNVVWALATKNHPGVGILQFPNREIFPLSPYLNPDERRDRRCTTVVFDCTWPHDWRPEEIPIRSSFDSLWPKDLQQRVLAHWSDYGYTSNSDNGEN